MFDPTQRPKAFFKPPVYELLIVRSFVQRFYPHTIHLNPATTFRCLMFMVCKSLLSTTISEHVVCIQQKKMEHTLFSSSPYLTGSIQVQTQYTNLN